jgi:C1A family cysteine protease
MSWLNWFFNKKRMERKPIANCEYNVNGMRPDKKDNRDYKLIKLTDLPVAYSLPINPQDYVKSQGNIGSCGSHAMATAIEISCKLNGKMQDIPLSELYHYYRVRELEGTLPNDAGQTARDMLKVAQDIGVAPERLMPYDIAKMNDKPGIMANSFAGYWKIDKYYRCFDVSDIKDAINRNQPVLIGVWVNKSFMSHYGDIIVADGEVTFGGHEIVCYGYDDVTQMLFCINSWDKYYKDNGCMKVPYNYVDKYQIDLWTFTM